MQELLNSGYLTEVHKFSKFIHGTATLLPDMVQARFVTLSPVHISALLARLEPAITYEHMLNCLFATSIHRKHTCPVEDKMACCRRWTLRWSAAEFCNCGISSSSLPSCSAGRAILGGRRVCAPIDAHVGTCTPG